MNLVYFFCNVQQFSHTVPELAKINITVYKCTRSVSLDSVLLHQLSLVNTGINSWIKTSNIEWKFMKSV